MEEIYVEVIFDDQILYGIINFKNWYYEIISYIIF